MNSRRFIVASFHHLVGSHLQRERNGQADRHCGFEVDHQFEFCRLNDWQVGGFLAFEIRPA